MGKGIVLGIIMASRDVQVLIIATVKILPYVPKGDFEHVLRLRILRWRVDPGLSGWAQCNHQGPYKRKQKAGESEKEI